MLIIIPKEGKRACLSKVIDWLMILETTLEKENIRDGNNGNDIKYFYYDVVRLYMMDSIPVENRRRTIQILLTRVGPQLYI